MEHNGDILALLQKQNALLTKQLRWTRIIAFVTLGLAAVILICLAVWGGRLNALLADCELMVTQLQLAVEEMRLVFTPLAEDLQTTAEGLAQVDWLALTQNINALAADAQAALTEAMEAVDTLDIETLNGAIADLKRIVEPLAKLLDRFS